MDGKAFAFAVWVGGGDEGGVVVVVVEGEKSIGTGAGDVGGCGGSRDLLFAGVGWFGDGLRNQLVRF